MVMPMRASTSSRENGSTLVVVLFTAFTVGIVVASYLSLIASRYTVTVRSQCWNAALPVLEAGVEEALAHIQADAGVPSANGWAPGTNGGLPVYTKARTLSAGCYYSVTLFNANSNNPIIYCTGYVPSPLQSGTYIARTVKVTATNTPTAFTKAVAALGTVTLGSLVDGYDSSLGPYDPVTNRLAIGAVATDSNAKPAVTVGGANVYGTVTTGPNGTVSVGSGAVGDTAWNASHTGVENGWTNNNMNVAFPTNAPPSGGPFLPPQVVNGGGSNFTVLGTGSYQLASFKSQQSKQPMMVNGNALLWVTGDFTVSGSGYVYIAPAASLILYVGGTTTISGGGVVNGPGLPSSFSYIGLSSNDSMTYSGSAAFVGTVNAPQAAFTLSGGATVYGAIICNRFSGTGGSIIHYDRVLGNSTSTGGTLVVSGWTEL
jgi:hypothetical protein